LQRMTITTTAKASHQADEPAISPVTISYTSIAALDADPLFKVDAASDPRIVQSLASVSMGMLVSFLMPYIKAALIKYLSEGVLSPTPAQVLSKAHAMAEAHAQAEEKAKVKEVKT
jgi:hypothetical protein